MLKPGIDGNFTPLLVANKNKLDSAMFSILDLLSSYVGSLVGSYCPLCLETMVVLTLFFVTQSDVEIVSLFTY